MLVIFFLFSIQFINFASSDELSLDDDYDEDEAGALHSSFNSTSLPPVPPTTATTGRTTAAKTEPTEGEEEEDEEDLIDSSRSSSAGDFAKEGESLSKLQKFMLQAVEGIIKQTLPTVVQSSLETNVSSECANSLLSLVSALRDSQLWAFRSK